MKVIKGVRFNNSNPVDLIQSKYIEWFSINNRRNTSDVVVYYIE